MSVFIFSNLTLSIASFWYIYSCLNFSCRLIMLNEHMTMSHSSSSIWSTWKTKAFWQDCLWKTNSFHRLVETIEYNCIYIWYDLIIIQHSTFRHAGCKDTGNCTMKPKFSLPCSQPPSWAHDWETHNQETSDQAM